MAEIKKNVLVTGSKGFIGTNLVNYLNNYQQYNIFEYVRNSTINDLDAYIEKIDFIFHFAGVVSLKNSYDQFENSNINLTSDIIGLILNNKLSIPILYTSSIHAIKKLDNYGLTKSESEKLLIQYSLKSNALVYILRLPHVYGEFQKKDRGSFLTDCIYNILDNKEINMKNPDNMINYLYVQDLVKQLYELFVTEKNNKGIFYPEINNIDRREVGSVINCIYEINENIQNEKYLLIDDFQKKLFKVFKFYYDFSNKA